MKKLAIISIDQGTTSTRTIAFSTEGKIIALTQRELTQYYPENGWVEQDPEEIWSNVVCTIRQTLAKSKELGYTPACIGITNQRETTVIWDKSTQKPIYNAIVWQDRRTADYCKQLDRHLPMLKKKSGLLLDPYFSASKINWILGNIPGAREQAERGHLAFGTIDSFLIWRLTNGKIHATEPSNASRTNLYNIFENQWDDDLLQLFDIPAAILPEVKNSADNFGTTTKEAIGTQLPISGIAGDQQAALFGQCCFAAGDVKSTYGTGCFMLVNTGDKPIVSNHKLLTTIAYQLNGKVSYALEGAIFSAGSNVQWLRDSLEVIENASQTQSLAESLDYDHGVVLVPGFAGLGAPHWSAKARASIFGMTSNTSAAHLARASLEAVCYQTYDLLNAMRDDGVEFCNIWVDGGMVANNWLCQFLADILNVGINRPSMRESTALGAAYLAGLQEQIYSDVDHIAKNRDLEHIFESKISSDLREKLLCKWQLAVQSTLQFADA